MLFFNKSNGRLESFEKHPGNGYCTPEEWLKEQNTKSKQEEISQGNEKEIQRKQDQVTAALNNINFQSICLIRSILCGTSDDNDLLLLKNLEVQAKDLLMQLAELQKVSKNS